MESKYYPNHGLNSISEDDTNPCTSVPADGLVYNHLQLTLQAQTDLKNQQRIQDFLNTASSDPLLDFDELYSSVKCESDLSYLQMMEQQTETAPFYTPFTDTTAFDMACLPPNNSVAGLDAKLDVSQQHLLCHPLSTFPDNAIHSDVFPCDYYLDDQDMLNELNCNNTFDYFDQLPSSSFMPPLMSYSLPPFHKTATPISALSNDHHHLAYRSNSTPMLSASFSFSSFSSASSNEDESLFDRDIQQTADNQMPPIPRKSASMSYISDPGIIAKKKKRMNNLKSELKKSKQKKVSISASSDSLSYYLARQQLCDTDEYDEHLGEESSRNMSTSSSTSAICKKGRNVDKACNHCKRSHLRCDSVRPCRRCVSTGKEGCEDVTHKPRGRPRLQKKHTTTISSVPEL